MTAEEWINEFSTQHQQPKTVLHASNIPAAAKGVVDEAPARARHIDAPRKGRARRGYQLGAMCVAGLVGFAMARTLTSRV